MKQESGGLCKNDQRGKKEKSSKKERRPWPVETAAAMEIQKTDFHGSLKIAAGDFHSSHRPCSYETQTYNRWQRSTLFPASGGPKDGEHLKDRTWNMLIVDGIE
jgi:hypothetical protein